MPFANPDEHDSDINILLLGETGVGKSTFINSFVNYLQHTTLYDAMKSKLECLIPLKFTIPNEDYEDRVIEFGSDQNEDTEIGNSSTQGARAYLFPFEDYNIRLIDTPGIGDARGTKQDELNFQNVLTYISQYKHLHGICFLLKPNVSVIHAYFKFCIVHLLSRLEKSAVNNIIFIFTNGRNTFYRPGETLPLLKRILQEIKESPPHVEVECSKKNMFCVDNESFKFLIAKKHGVKFEDTETKLFAMSWRTSYKTCKDILSYICGDKNNDPLLPHDILNTVTVNEARKVIIELLKPLADISDYILNHMKVLEDRVTFLQQENSTKNELIKLLYIPSIEFKVIKLDEPMTVCTSPKCSQLQMCGEFKTYQYKQICHKPCYLSNVPEEIVGTPELKNCLAMNNGETCTECECNYSVHMHVYYETEIVQSNQENVSVKNKIKTRKEALKESSAFVQKLKKNIADLNEEKNKIIKCMAKFAHFLGNNSISTYNDMYLDYLIHLIGRENSLGEQKNEARLKHYTSLKSQYEEEKKKLSACKSGKDPKVVNASDIPDLVQSLYNLPLTGSKISTLHKIQQHSIQKSGHSLEFRYPTVLKKFASESSLSDEDEEIPMFESRQSPMPNEQLQQEELKLIDEQFSNVAKKLMASTVAKKTQKEMFPKENYSTITDTELNVTESMIVAEEERSKDNELIMDVSEEEVSKDDSVNISVQTVSRDNRLKVTESYIAVREEEVLKDDGARVTEKEVSGEGEVTESHMEVCEEEVLKVDELNVTESHMHVCEEEVSKINELNVTDLDMDVSEEELFEDDKVNVNESCVRVSEPKVSEVDELKVTQSMDVSKGDKLKMSESINVSSEQVPSKNISKGVFEYDYASKETELKMTKKGHIVKITESCINVLKNRVFKDDGLEVTDSCVNVSKKKASKDDELKATKSSLNVSKISNKDKLKVTKKEDKGNVTELYINVSKNEVAKNDGLEPTESCIIVSKAEASRVNVSDEQATNADQSNEIESHVFNKDSSKGDELKVFEKEEISKNDEFKVTESYVYVSKEEVSKDDGFEVTKSYMNVYKDDASKVDELKVIEREDDMNVTKSYMDVPKKEFSKDHELNASKGDDGLNVTESCVKVFKEDASKDDAVIKKEDDMNVCKSQMDVPEKEFSKDHELKASKSYIDVSKGDVGLNVTESCVKVFKEDASKDNAVIKKEESCINVLKNRVFKDDGLEVTDSCVNVSKKKASKDDELKATKSSLNVSKISNKDKLKVTKKEDKGNVSELYINVSKNEVAKDDGLEPTESCIIVSKAEASRVNVSDEQATNADQSNEIESHVFNKDSSKGDELKVFEKEEISKNDEFKYVYVSKEEVSKDDGFEVTKSYMNVYKDDASKVDELKVIEREDDMNVTKSYMDVPKKEFSKDHELNASKGDDGLNVTESCVKVFKEDASKDDAVIKKEDDINVGKSQMDVPEKEFSKDHELKVSKSYIDVSKGDVGLNVTESCVKVFKEDASKDDAVIKEEDDMNVTKSHMDVPENKISTDHKLKASKSYIDVSKGGDELIVTDSCVKVFKEDASKDDAVIKEEDDMNVIKSHMDVPEKKISTDNELKVSKSYINISKGDDGFNVTKSCVKVFKKDASKNDAVIQKEDDMNVIKSHMDVPEKEFSTDHELKASKSYIDVSKGDDGLNVTESCVKVFKEDASNAHVSKGELSKDGILKEIKSFLNVAEEELSTDNKLKMIKSYIDAFHKEASRDDKSRVTKEGVSKEDKRNIVSEDEVSKGDEFKVTKPKINASKVEDGLKVNKSCVNVSEDEDTLKVNKPHVKASKNVELKVNKLKEDQLNVPEEDVSNEFIVTKSYASVVKEDALKGNELKLIKAYVNFYEEEDIANDGILNVIKEGVAKKDQENVTESCINVSKKEVLIDNGLNVTDSYLNISEEEVSKEGELKATESSLNVSEEVSKEDELSLNVSEEEVSSEDEPEESLMAVEKDKNQKAFYRRVFHHLGEHASRYCCILGLLFVYSICHIIFFLC